MRLSQRVFLTAFSLLAFALVACAVSEEAAEQADIDIADAPIDVQVTALQLVEDYENNEVAANQKYNGKVLSVSGTVESISGGTDGDALYVDLKAGDFSLNSVRCYFGPNRLDEVLAMVKGDKVVFRGLGDEEENRYPFAVEVIGCSVIEN